MPFLSRTSLKNRTARRKRDQVEQGADPDKALLRRRNFRNCQLEHFDFYDADLAGATLEGAHLGGANLTGALLEDANLLRRARAICKLCIGSA
jgi:uncharacterized protein YjbI with pentapeptide repeats